MPALDEAEDGSFYYSNANQGLDKQIVFTYNPENSDPEYITMGWESFAPNLQKNCWIRKPGATNLNGPRQGQYFDHLSIPVSLTSYRYVTTGEMGNAPTCTATRVK